MDKYTHGTDDKMMCSMGMFIMGTNSGWSSMELIITILYVSRIESDRAIPHTGLSRCVNLMSRI